MARYTNAPKIMHCGRVFKRVSGYTLPDRMSAEFVVQRLRNQKAAKHFLLRQETENGNWNIYKN